MGTALDLGRVNSIVNKELKTLKIEAAETEVTAKMLDTAYEDVAALKSQMNQIIQIDKQLDFLFKSVQTSFRKVETQALTGRQAAGYGNVMAAAVGACNDIRSRAQAVESHLHDDLKNAKAIARKLELTARKVRAQVRRIEKLDQDTQKRTDQIQAIANEVTYKVMGHTANVPTWRGPAKAVEQAYIKR
ncbi:MAG: hypothetical protein ABIG93_04310 [archaeon]|nr:hypothetical protein [Nanoarchaeota archaeon]